MLIFEIKGKPIAWKRPGEKKGGGRYDTQKKRKAGFAFECWTQHQVEEMLDMPLRMVVTCYFDGDLGFDGDYYTSTPDASNLLKFVEDALEGHFYSNDKFIVDSRCIKRYGPERTVVEIFDAEYKGVEE